MNNWLSRNTILFIYLLCAFIPTRAEHSTKQSKEKQIDLYCYHCDSMDDGLNCQDLRDNSTFHTKCPNDQRMCKVKSILMSASTEDVTGKPILWLLQRNCTKTCEPGCIVIGERTKLHSCTTCCEQNLCNTGSGSESNKRIYDKLTLIYILCIIEAIGLYQTPLIT